MSLLKHFANSLNRVVARVIVSLLLFFLLTRGLAKLLFRVWQSRRLYDRPGRGWQVTRLCVPHL